MSVGARIPPGLGGPDTVDPGGDTVDSGRDTVDSGRDTVDSGRDTVDPGRDLLTSGRVAGLSIEKRALLEKRLRRTATPATIDRRPARASLVASSAQER